MHKFIALALLLGLKPVLLCAQNLGNYGEVFPIIEQDIRQIIFDKLHQMEHTGELKRLSKQFIARVEQQVKRPKPLALSTTLSPKDFTVNPSIVVNRNLYTHDGLLISPAGRRLNPFQHISFSKTLFFFNADDATQLSWVKKHYQDYNQVKFILTGGDVKEAASQLGFIYFDWDGRLSRYFHLKHVPALVRQQGLVWRIQEIGRQEL